MSTNPSNRQAQLVEIAKAIGAIVGVPLVLFTLVNNFVEQPVVALVAALITAALASVWVVRSRRIAITQVVVAWLALIVVVLAGFVIWLIWPKTMTVEGIIRDTAGNPVNNEEIVLFDLSGRRYETKTNAEGYYQFVDVPAGKYKVRARGNEVEGATTGILVRMVQQNLTVAPIVVTVSPTPTPTDTPTPIMTNTPTPTPTPTPTNTPTPNTLCSWNGTPGDPNSGVVSDDEAIWRDESDDDTGDGDYSYPGDSSVSMGFWGTSAADIEEFRVKTDGQSICLMIRVADIPDEAIWIPHLALYINNNFPQSSTQTDLAESVEAHTPSDWTWEYIIVLESETVEVFDVFNLWVPRSEGVVGRMDPVNNVYEVRLPMTAQLWTGVGDPAGQEWGFLLWAGLSDRGEAREVLVSPNRDYPGGGDLGPDDFEADGTPVQNTDPDIFDLIGSVREVQEGDLATYTKDSSALIDESWIWVLFDENGVPQTVRTPQ